MNKPIVNIPAANGPLVTGPVRIGREYTGKHRRDTGAGPLSPWRRTEPDGMPLTGTGPAAGSRPDARTRPEGGPWADAR